MPAHERPPRDPAVTAPKITGDTAMPDDRQSSPLAQDLPTGVDFGAVPMATDLGVELPAREMQLYLRYLRALALLCECAPSIDEPDYRGMIDDVLADACSHYPLVTRRHGDSLEIAPRPSPAE
jgi:hypothetical protein